MTAAILFRLLPTPAIWATDVKAVPIASGIVPPGASYAVGAAIAPVDLSVRTLSLGGLSLGDSGAFSTGVSLPVRTAQQVGAVAPAHSLDVRTVAPSGGLRLQLLPGSGRGVIPYSSLSGVHAATPLRGPAAQAFSGSHIYRSYTALPEAAKPDASAGRGSLQTGLSVLRSVFRELQAGDADPSAILNRVFTGMAANGRVGNSRVVRASVRSRGRPALQTDARVVQGLKRRILRELGLTLDRNVSIVTDDVWYTFGRKRYKREYWDQKIETRPFSKRIMVRFGPLFFMEESIYRNLSPKLKEDLDPNIIRFRNLERSIIGDTLGLFTMTAIAIMLNIDISGRHIIDAGAADAILSLVAAKLGAAQLTLIEYEPAEVAKARASLKLNGFREGRNIKVIRADLTDTEGTVSKLPRSSLPTVIFASIGTYAADYIATNADVMALIPYLFHVERFLASGYHTGAPKGGIYHMLADQRLIRHLGFKVEPLLGSRKRDFVDVHAFTAVPDEGVEVRLFDFLDALKSARRTHRENLSTELRGKINWGELD